MISEEAKLSCLKNQRIEKKKVNYSFKKSFHNEAQYLKKQDKARVVVVVVPFVVKGGSSRSIPQQMTDDWLIIIMLI